MYLPIDHLRLACFRYRLFLREGEEGVEQRELLGCERRLSDGEDD